jgi:YjbE family integral membrane protein
LEWGIVAGILNIIVINLVLSGDNAVVIAMASSGLDHQYRKKAIFWGATLAVVLRILLTFVAAFLLKIPLVQVIGGSLLAFIAINLLNPKEEHAEEKQGTSSYKKAILTILWADLLMSLDNVLAVAGAAGGNFLLLVFGIAISIPIVLAGSTLLTKLMDKYPWLSYVGAGVLAWTAGEMIVEDKLAAQYLHSIPYAEHLIPVILVILVIGIGKIRINKSLAADKAESVEGYELN